MAAAGVALLAAALLPDTSGLRAPPRSGSGGCGQRWRLCAAVVGAEGKERYPHAGRGPLSGPACPSQP